MAKRQQGNIQPVWMDGQKVEGTHVYLLVSEDDLHGLTNGIVTAAVNAQAHRCIEAIYWLEPTEAPVAERKRREA